MVGAAATGLVVFVFALFAPVLASGPPHAAKNVDDHRYHEILVELKA